MSKSNKVSFLEGKNVTIVKHFGDGSLTSRYIVNVDDVDYFVKTHVSSNFCPGMASRHILENEVGVQEHLVDIGNSLYRGFGEIEDTLCVFFEEMTQGRNGKTLAERIGVKDNFTAEQRENFKQTGIDLRTMVKAENYKKSFKLFEVVDIVKKVAAQAQEVHMLGNGEEGIIHMDISLENIILTQEFKDGVLTRNVLLNDYGIARAKDKDIRKLYNGFLVKGVTGGNYYGSPGDILHNIIYSPPDYDQYDKAEPSYDTYCITNILCMMTTGKMVEYWKDQALKKNVDVKDLLFDAVKDFSLQDDKKIYTKLVDIIIKGTLGIKDRYQVAQELVDDLEKLAITSVNEVVQKLELPLDIPDMVKNYDLKLPPGKETFAEVYEQARLGLSQSIVSDVLLTPDNPFVGINTHIADLRQQTVEQYQLKNKQYKNRLKWLGRVASGVLVAGALVCGGFAYHSCDTDKTTPTHKTTPQLMLQQKKNQTNVPSLNNQSKSQLSQEQANSNLPLTLDQIVDNKIVEESEVILPKLSTIVNYEGVGNKILPEVKVVSPKVEDTSLKPQYISPPVQNPPIIKQRVRPYVPTADVPVVIPKLKLVINEENKKYTYGDRVHMGYSLFKDNSIVTKPNCGVNLEGLDVSKFSKSDNEIEGTILQTTEQRSNNKGILTIKCKEGLGKIEKEVEINFEPKLELLVQKESKTYQYGSKVEINYFVQKNGFYLTNPNCSVKVDPWLRLNSFTDNNGVIKGVIPFFIGKSAASKEMIPESRYITVKCTDGSWNEEKKILIAVESTVEYNAPKVVTKPKLYNPSHNLLSSADICDGCEFTIYEINNCSLIRDTNGFKLSKIDKSRYQLDRKEKLPTGDYTLDLLCNKDYLFYEYTLPIKIKSVNLSGQDAVSFKNITPLEGEYKLKSGEYCTNCDLKVTSIDDVKCEMEKNEGGFYLQRIKQTNKSIGRDSTIKIKETNWRINRDIIVGNYYGLKIDNFKVNCGDLGSRPVVFYLMQAPPISSK